MHPWPILEALFTSNIAWHCAVFSLPVSSLISADACSPYKQTIYLWCSNFMVSWAQFQLISPTVLNYCIPRITPKVLLGNTKKSATNTRSLNFHCTWLHFLVITSCLSDANVTGKPWIYWDLKPNIFIQFALIKLCVLPVSIKNGITCFLIMPCICSVLPPATPCRALREIQMM